MEGDSGLSSHRLPTHRALGAELRVEDPSGCRAELRCYAPRPKGWHDGRRDGDQLFSGGAILTDDDSITTEQRDAITARLKECGIPTAVYYMLPVNRQTAYRDYPTAPGGTPVSDDLSHRALSLPMHPYLDEAKQDRIVATLREAA